MLTEKAYGKINLFLDLIGIRENGYHDIYTVMQSVSLHDIISLEVEPDVPFEVSLYCDGAELSCGDDNLIVRAAKRMQSLHPTIRGAHRFALQKNIPIAAGMAGGSADAAATLLAINELTEFSLPQKVLLEIGSRLGSDIPFCIQSCTAFANGKGDILHPFPPMPHCYILVCCAGEGVSTPFAYRLLDDIHNGFGENSSYIPQDMTTLKNAMENSDISAVCSSMYNIFDEPILSVRPVATQVKKIMLESGAMGAMMSGSGPSIFGIFNSKDAAEFANKELQKYGYTGIVCKN